MLLSFFAKLLGAVAPVSAVVWWLVRWSAPTDYFEVLQLPRLNATAPGALAYFFERFHGRTPVLIVGALDSWPAMQWDVAYLSSQCPDAQVPLYAYDTQSGDWAALKEVGSKNLSEYLQGEFGHPARPAGEKMYALEMSLRSECPKLLADIRIPAFFSDDMLLRYHDRISWPTLIAGPQGTRSGLHRDTHNLPFYMAMFKGRKQWRILSTETESQQAYEPYFDSGTNGFSFDAFTPDMQRFAGLRKVTAYDHVLEPGQLLYIPSGAPHAARNLDDTIAISGNYLDSRALPHHKEATCKGSMWMTSPLCVVDMSVFERHRAVPPVSMTERSYFEQAGYTGPAEWCSKLLTQWRARSIKRPELARNIPIIASYCRKARKTRMNV